MAYRPTPGMTAGAGPKTIWPMRCKLARRRVATGNDGCASATALAGGAGGFSGLAACSATFAAASAFGLVGWFSRASPSPAPEDRAPDADTAVAGRDWFPDVGSRVTAMMSAAASAASLHERAEKRRDIALPAGCPATTNATATAPEGEAPKVASTDRAESPSTK